FPLTPPWSASRTAALRNLSCSLERQDRGAGESMSKSPVLSVDGASPQPLVRASAKPRGLRASLQAVLPLLILDAGAIFLAWSVVAFLVEGRLQYPGSHIGSPLMVLAVAAFILIGNHARGLYAEARADRAVELVGCARSCFVAAIAVMVAGQAAGLEPGPWRAAAATAGCVLLLVVARSAYRARMTVRRRANEAVRPAIVVGTNDEAFELCRLLDQDPAFGFRPWGVVGERSQYDRYPFDPPWLGGIDSIASAVQHFGIDHVFVARTALSSAAFAELTRGLTAKGVHVAASSGLPSIDQRRLKIMTIAQMPVYWLEATGPSS